MTPSATTSAAGRAGAALAIGATTGLHEAGISSNNAGVRIFRAREALRKQVARSCGTCATHGCVDCTCDQTAKHGCH